MQDLITHYQAKALAFDSQKRTEVGVFCPTNLEYIRPVLTELLLEGIIVTGQSFLDAGSGDGRIVAMADRMGFKAYGVEYDEKLVLESKSHLETIVSNGIILCGDFTSESTYNGMKFSDFEIVFNYVNGEGALAAKIASESASGTKFLFVDNASDFRKFAGLSPVRKLKVRDHAKVIPEFRKVTMFVYSKE